MQFFLFGLLLLAVGLIVLRGYARANPAALARQVRTLSGVAALGGAALLLVRGLVSYAMPLMMLGSWLLWGTQGPTWGGGWFPRRGAKSAGQSTRVETAHLEMELDHDTGAMRGRIIKGVFKGRDIESMAPAEMALLWQDCRFADPQSAQLIEAYLDRTHATWREDMARAEATPGAGGVMTRDEALSVLGLKSSATHDDIRAAHRDLMKRLHPDRGGSTYLAAKINQAKDLLLET